MILGTLMIIAGVLLIILALGFGLPAALGAIFSGDILMALLGLAIIVVAFFVGSGGLGLLILGFIRFT